MPFRKNKPFSPQSGHFGLCYYCKFADECDFPRHPEQPVTNCDEFEVSDTLSQEIQKENQSLYKYSSKWDEIGEANKGNLLGLCRNCERRNTCTFPKREGGVWHCEEYE
jgi:glutaredoxin